MLNFGVGCSSSIIISNVMKFYQGHRQRGAGGLSFPHQIPGCPPLPLSFPNEMTLCTGPLRYPDPAPYRPVILKNLATTLCFIIDNTYKKCLQYCEYNVDHNS